MTGKSHEALGFAVGAAFTIYGIRNGMPLMSLALVASPAMALLPDIDHSGSRVGSARKRFVDIVIRVTALVFMAAAIYYGWYLKDYATLLRLGLLVAVPLFLLTAISRLQIVRFATMHRGIMHTLLLPALISYAATTLINEEVLRYLLYGGAAGYLSHIVADCLTPRGCPILFPLTINNINILAIRSGSGMEKTAVFMLSAATIAFAVVI